MEHDENNSVCILNLPLTNAQKGPCGIAFVLSGQRLL